MSNKSIPLSQTLPNVSALAYGCMGLGGGWDSAPITNEHRSHAHAAVEAALESGINLFDHADIYTKGKAEAVFGDVLKSTPSLKENMYIQSKCGIRFEDDLGAGRYDFSAQWVTESTEGILTRLGIEQLDILLLHRPDPLVEFEELADALHKLHAAGKVAHFGVSNMNAAQIRRLQTYLDHPIVINQVEMSLAKVDFIKQGIALPFEGDQFSQGTLEHCQEHNIQLQAWGCLAQGRFSEQGFTSDNEAVRATAHYVAQLAEQYQVSSEAIVLAFLTRHPSGIQPVIGTTNPKRIKACADAVNVNLTRAEWYTLLTYSMGNPVP
ncbi:aldo/keto reductase [Vibrio sp.]|nr:aldo/keto reductase [Vibrio sp.]